MIAALLSVALVVVLPFAAAGLGYWLGGKAARRRRQRFLAEADGRCFFVWQTAPRFDEIERRVVDRLPSTIQPWPQVGRRLSTMFAPAGDRRAYVELPALVIVRSGQTYVDSVAELVGVSLDEQDELVDGLDAAAPDATGALHGLPAALAHREAELRAAAGRPVSAGGRFTSVASPAFPA